MGVFFHEGGFGMFPTLVFGFLLLLAAGQSLFRKDRRALIGILAALTFSSGMLGTSMGIINTARYVAKTSEWIIAPVGIAESLNNAVLAGILLCLALIIAAVGELRGTKAA